MAAVLFYAENQKEKYLGYEIGMDSEESVDKLVKEADETIVNDFLIDILENDEKLLNRFRAALLCKITLADISRYKNQVNEIFRRYAVKQYYIDHFIKIKAYDKAMMNELERR